MCPIDNVIIITVATGDVFENLNVIEKGIDRLGVAKSAHRVKQRIGPNRKSHRVSDRFDVGVGHASHRKSLNPKYESVTPVEESNWTKYGFCVLG